MKRFLRGAGFYIILILVILLLTTFFSGGRSTSQKAKINYDDLIKEIAQDNIKIVYIDYQNLYGLYKDSTVLENSFPGEYDFSTRILSDESFFNDVRIAKGDENLSVQNFGFKVVVAEEQSTSFLMLLLPYLGIIIVIVVFWFIMMRQQGGGGKVMNFGKSRHRVAEDNRKRVTFADVEGATEEKDELREIVDFLKDPRKFLELGARIPKGVLLVGPPGTGKTLLAKAVAGEANVQFFSISGSDFVEMFVGVGASRVRDLFDQAKKNLPCIVFIDEIDAVGRHRGAGLGGGHDEREQTLNQLLVEMDGFTQNEGIIIIAATNRPDILDPALLRPGRFDRQITVQYPDIGGREAILKLHAKNKPVGADVDMKAIARRTPMFTGADLENILNEAAILAARKNKKEINMDEITEAIARVEMGPEKRSRIVTERDRKLVAYHESGHAIVAYYLPNCDPVNEVSIIPRGMAGGYTQTVSNEDTSFVSRAAILDRITMSMGGHAAEKLIMNDVTTGSNSDLQNATGLVRRMVTEFGMSDLVGPVYLGGENEVFLGRNYTTQHTYSERVASEVDAEIHKILKNAYSQAIDLLNTHIDKLHGLANMLLEKEKIDGEEFKAFMSDETHAEEPAPVAAE